MVLRRVDRIHSDRIGLELLKIWDISLTVRRAGERVDVLRCTCTGSSRSGSSAVIVFCMGVSAATAMRVADYKRWYATPLI